ncbi:hypothetical protein DSO57_1011358 [Entomophthora muscae]|uniref:Uncharacterized protein n=1 Tax=Entomophthora muscae TaxID=34485 RepID=A0ACC2SVF3_9FUNG|nr:hypothetical protein DSO57_1011358 [Entomophthora muscae]
MNQEPIQAIHIKKDIPDNSLPRNHSANKCLSCQVEDSPNRSGYPAGKTPNSSENSPLPNPRYLPGQHNTYCRGSGCTSILAISITPNIQSLPDLVPFQYTI